MAWAQSMVKRAPEIWPWLWQHSVLCTVGLFRGAHGYQPPKHMRIDAMPDPPEPEE